jgi:hypothetical protein
MQELYTQKITMLPKNPIRNNTIHISPDQQDVRGQFLFDRNTQKAKGLISIRAIILNQKHNNHVLLPAFIHD